MKKNITSSNRAGRWFGVGYITKPNSLFRYLAGKLPGLLLWLAVLPLAALGQAKYTTPYTFTTIVGKKGAPGSMDGTNSAARLNYPVGVAVDAHGNLFVPEYGSNTIRAVKPVGTSWVVTTVAGKAGSPGSTDGTNTDARFNFTSGNYFGSGLAVDNAGNIYLPDAGNHTIRKMAPIGTNWVVTTLAGFPGSHGSADGTNSDARFFCPMGLAVDTNGSIYVADSLNDTIRKVTPDGTNWVVTTLAGKTGSPGSADGTGSAARFNVPGYPGLDSAGNVYVPDCLNHTVRKVTPIGTNWVVTTLSGRVGISGGTDGTNGAARFYWPVQVVVDSSDTLYVADSGNDTIRKVTPDGTNWVVTTVAGLAGSAGSTDGTGSAARFNFAGEGGAIAVDSTGNLYVADFVNHTIREGFPASSVPPPVLEPPSLSAGQFGFGITGLPGLAVNIESSTNLSSWQLKTTSILVGGTNYYSISPDPALGAQFYRAHVR